MLSTVEYYCVVLQKSSIDTVSLLILERAWLLLVVEEDVCAQWATLLINKDEYLLILKSLWTLYVIFLCCHSFFFYL